MGNSKLVLKQKQKTKEVNMPGNGGGGQIWSQAAANTATGVFGIAAQRIGAKYDRRQQLKTQEELNEMSMGYNKEMARYGKELDLQMWNDTGYGAQMKQMKDAGINPGLMYGMGGGGAQTTGGGSPGGGTPSAGIRDTGGMAIQPVAVADMMLKKAQAENLNADTKVKLEGIPNIGKAGVKLDTETESLKQGITNMKAQKALTEADTRIKTIIGNVSEQTQDDQKVKYHAETNKALDEARSAMAQAGVDEKTADSKIEILKQNAIGAAIENRLGEAKTSLTKQQIDNLKNEITQNWEKLSLQSESNMISKMVAEVAGQNADTGVVNSIVNALKEIFSIFSKKKK